MEENSSRQMGLFFRQWLLEIRFPCHDSENSSQNIIFINYVYFKSILENFVILNKKFL